MYSRPAIFRYFFEVYCSPTLQETHWHQRTRRSNSQNVPLSVSTVHNSTSHTQPDEHSSVLLTTTTARSVPRPIPTAPTNTIFNDKFSIGKISLPLTGPMISYCPPWPPPHHKCWYPSNATMTLPQPQYQYQSNERRQHDTQYYYDRRPHYRQYGVDWITPITADKSYLLAPPAPTADDKNLLRPP